NTLISPDKSRPLEPKKESSRVFRYKTFAFRATYDISHRSLLAWGEQLDLKVFVKPSKSNAYFKRYQVKFRRRRDGKTDYRARIRLINQDKNKYNTPKYRFVVRFTNKDIVAQIVSASIAGDIVKASAYAHELPQYGLTVGLTNYAAAYCTGLLLARRVLKMLEMDEEYEGNLEATGEDFSVEPTESRRPFRALLDVGLIRTTTGNRVFGALKGALDGGLDIPHSDKRFAGFNKENKQLDAEIHRNYIYGGHVSNYMKMLNEDEPEKFQTHFSQYLKKGVDAESMEELYKKVHAAIRADPNPKKTKKPAPKTHKRYNLKKLTYEERKNKLIERVKALNGAAGGDDDDEDDEDFLQRFLRFFIFVFVKPSKSNAYFKRYQVKFRRRRDGKTDYRARIRLINQDKNKYNTPKYRFVVRFTNKDIVAQIVSASIAGDIVKASAYAHELPQYGLTVGLTNYAAAYCTGLLLARRVLKMLEMDEEYEGNLEATGEDFSVEPTESRRPFRALLDVGLIRTTTGNRVFGALKGALDGGLDIPHSDKRFAGFNKENKQLDAEIHRNYIYGGHVSNYMKMLNEDEPEKFQTHFSQYLKKGVDAESMEELYKKVHAAIRADPNPKKTEKPAPKTHKRYNLKKLTYEERKNKLIERVKALNGAAGGDDDDEDDEE
ncbi:hypothetical protein HID58_054388, partial [Brassica napus]